MASQHTFTYNVFNAFDVLGLYGNPVVINGRIVGSAYPYGRIPEDVPYQPTKGPSNFQFVCCEETSQSDRDNARRQIDSFLNDIEENKISLPRKGNAAGDMLPYELNKQMANCIGDKLRNRMFTVTCTDRTLGASAYAIPYNNNINLLKGYYVGDQGRQIGTTIIHETVHSCGKIGHSQPDFYLYPDWLRQDENPADQWENLFRERYTM